MPTPVMSLRVPPEQQDLVRRIVAALKRDAGLEERLREALDQPAAGPFRSEAAALRFLCNRLAIALQPEAIYLFGSRARGDHRADSDFDLLVVFPDDRGDSADDDHALYQPLAGSGLTVDAIPCAASTFAAEKDEPGTLAYAAHHQGRLVYRRRVRP